MKKYLSHIFILTFLLGLTGVFGVHVAQAGVGDVLTFANSPVETSVQFLANLVLQAMSFFIYISGLLLDHSLEWTLNIASLVKDIGAVETGWKVFRDLCTMFFIFILLYNAISVILGKSSTEEAKKVVTSIVIAGLLINFSLFFTKIIIDASNVVSLGFYKALVPTPDSVNSSLGSGFQSRTGLSAIFMDSLYIQTSYDPTGLKTITNDKLSGSGATTGAPLFIRIMLNTIMGSIVMLIASIVFLAGAFFFMVRIVMLLILMVTSPIAFAGQALGGKAAKQADKWWSTLIDQCLFMPVYLAVTYVGVKIIASPGFQTAVNPGAGSMSAMSGGGSVAVIFNYCVVIIFLMASLVIAKEFGVMGADTFSGWAKNVGLALPRLMGTGGSVLARNTLGRAGAELDKKYGNTIFGNSRIGRSLRDVTTGALAESKFGGSMSMKDQKKLDKEIKTKEDSINKKATIERGINTTGNSVDAATLNAIKNMSGKQIESLGLSDAQLKTLMPHLNKSQAEHMTEKSELPEEKKEGLRTARLANLRNATSTGAGVIGEIDKLSDAEIENLDDSILINTNFIKAISENPDKLKKLLGSSINQTTKDTIRNEIKRQNISTLTTSGDPDKIKKLLGSLPVKDLVEILENPANTNSIVNNGDFINSLKVSKLKELANDLQEPIKIDIGNKIMSTPGHGALNYITDPIGKTDRWR